MENKVPPRPEPLPPYPHIRDEDGDLTGVVRRLSPVHRRGTSSNKRDPNEPDVRWLLEAGVEALVERFCSYGDSGLSGYTVANDVLGSVSLNDVMIHFRDLAQQHAVNVGAANKDRIGRRWATVSDYQRDLIAYVFRKSYHTARMQLIVHELPRLLTGPFGPLVDVLAVSETDEVQSDDVLRLQLALSTAFPNDAQIQAYAVDVYTSQAESWAKVYEGIAATYGLRFSASFEDIAQMLNVVVEGSYLRRSASTRVGTLSNGIHVAVEMIHLLLAQLTGRPWSELARLMARDVGVGS